MSRAARRLQRRQQRQQHRRPQGEARTISLPLDRQWVEQLDRLSEKIRDNVRDSRAITASAAQLLGMSGEDAAECLERYYDETDGDHPQGLLGWLANRPEAVEVGLPTESRPHTAPEDDVPLPSLTLSVSYAPGASPFTSESSRVTISMHPDPDAGCHFPISVETPEGLLTEANSRALIDWTLDYLHRTWSVHGDAVDMLRHEPRYVERVRTPVDAAVNAKGGAA